MNKKIVFMGTPSFGIPSLKYLHETYGVSLVVTQPDRPVGRKRILTAPPIKEVAQALGIEVFQPLNIRKEYHRIIDLKPDLIVTAAYGQMIPDEVLNCAISLNIHGSILPKYRGGAPVQWAIMNGDDITGVTLMYMASEMDSGDIIDVSKTPILDSDTTTSLLEKLSFMGRDLLMKHIEDIFTGTSPRVKQDHLKATYAYNLKPEDEILDFHKPTKLVLRQLSGLLDDIGGSFFVGNTRIKVYKAEKSDIISNRRPSEVISVHKELIIKTKDGAVRINVLQEQGKKVMTDQAYLNGQKLLKEGDVVNA